MTKGKVVWLVEDSQEEANEYGQLLERAGDIEVLFVSVRPTIADYADLLADDRTGAFIIDQCLDEYTGVAYNGIDLAEFLRSLRPELPIFILTKYLDEGLEDQGGSVEAIIDKKTVRKRGEIYVKRILRGIEHYHLFSATPQLGLDWGGDSPIRSQICCWTGRNFGKWTSS